MAKKIGFHLRHQFQFQLFFPQVAPVFLDLILERGLLGDNETLPACRLKRFLKEEHKV